MSNNLRDEKLSHGNTDPAGASEPNPDPNAHLDAAIPGDEPEEERHAEVEAAQDGDLDRTGAEHEDRDQRQRDPRDERAEDRDRSRGPDADEGRVAPQRGAERVAHDVGA